jgi:predicted TIM-barrel fold metal-dependent hydrolase
MPKRSVPVLDFHVHFVTPGPSGRAAAGADGALTYAQRQYRWMLDAWNFPDPEPTPDPDEVLRRWLGEMERYALSGVVFVTGPGAPFMAEAQRRYPDKVYAFSHVSPDDPDAVQKLRRELDDYGLKGYKCFGPRFEHPLDDRRYWPLWELLAERRRPVLIHYGVLGGGGGIVFHPRMSPLTIDPVARAFPELPIVVPHFGAGYWGDLLQLGWAHENVMVDTSGSNQWVRWMPYPLTLGDLVRKAYETFGPDRIIFGTDSQYFPRGFAARYLEDFVRECAYAAIPQEAMRKMLHDNAWALLHPGETPPVSAVDEVGRP